ncbi:MAG: glycosyltransferase family 4 protein [Deltaproteobacteria bacterium]|nr:glycosyltransferase family 4 protein [Deltaproteobacteria bacterium]
MSRDLLRVVARPAFKNQAVNPYNARIYGGMDRYGIQVVEYGPAALLARPDIVHVHWPESSFNHGLLGARLTTHALLLALKSARQRGAKIVWTMHNLRAHERRYPSTEAVFWQRFLPLVDATIALSQASLDFARQARPEIADKPSFVVRHPDYRGAYPDDVDRIEARRRLGLPPETQAVITFFGHIKAYKNVPALIETVRALPPDIVLLVAGRARDPSAAELIRNAAGNDPRIRLTLRHIEDDETQLFFRAADLVALPYHDILNSGTALLALSFDRPVWLSVGGEPSEGGANTVADGVDAASAASATDASGSARALARDLQAAVGTQWVRSGPLSAEQLQAALLGSQQLPERTSGDHLRLFSPAAVTQTTAGVFHSVVAQP